MIEPNDAVTQDDIAGLIALAEFLDAMQADGTLDAPGVSDQMRALATKLARQVIVQ